MKNMKNKKTATKTIASVNWRFQDFKHEFEAMGLIEKILFHDEVQQAYKKSISELDADEVQQVYQQAYEVKQAYEVQQAYQQACREIDAILSGVD